MRFFRRYNYIILITFIFVFTVAAGLFYLQYDTYYHHEIMQLSNSFKERLNSLESTIQTAKYQVDGFKIKAEAFLKTYPGRPPVSPLFSQLNATSQRTYNLDVLKPPFNEKIVGNLTGIGTLENQDVHFYREIEMALDLNPLFQIAAHTIPNAVWAYYTSANNFINLYPWTVSKEFAFTQELHTHEFYYLGLPDNNPKRKTFWSHAYIDAAGAAGKGLIVTCAAPVYDNQKFMGTAALDFTLDELNRFVKNFKFPSENFFIINDNQLLAHVRLVSSQDKEIKTVDKAFPEEIRSQAHTLPQYPEGEFIKLGDYLVIYKDLIHAPWKLVFLLPKKDIVKEILYRISWSMGILLLGLFTILFVTNRVMQQEFIHPAELLIEHIEKESRGVSGNIPQVPKTWQKWFKTVSDSFEENRQLFIELQSYSKSLLTLNKEKNELLGIVAHDLKNPLFAVLGSLEIMQDAEGNLTKEEILEYTGLIQAGADTMFQLITNLLDVNVIESGKINVNLKVENLSPIVERVIKEYTERAKNKNITIQLTNNASDYVFVDTHLTQQILDNLISNAVKYSPLGKTVRVKLSNCEHYVRCEIQNEGQGLTPEEMGKLFNKFSRLSVRPTAGEHSTGLGLFIVKKLVDALHGRVRCESEVGKGANFIVEFPKKWST